MEERLEVVIVGAGPVGLTLALGLARRGVEVLVLEKNDRTAEHSRAPAIWPPSQRVLAGLGVLERFTSEGIVLRQVTLSDADRGRELITLPIEELADLTAHPQLLILPQSRTEQLLCEAVRATGAEIRFGAEVLGLRQAPAEVQIRYRSGGRERTLASSFVAGCDGASSSVRKSIGATFDGITYETRAALADVRFPGHDGLPFPRLTTRPTLAVAVRIDGGLWRLILPIGGGDERPLETRIADAARALLPPGVQRVVWQSEFELHRRVSSRFAHARVALAGDAAHLNSPVGGQGMNAGIADAEALADALAAAVETDDPAPLGAYAERRRTAVQSGVNPFTDRMTRLLLFGGGRLIRPALRSARWALAAPPLRRRLLRRLAMLDTV